MEKSVRDKIPEIIEAEGKKIVWRIADDNEYRKMLVSKIKEEASEAEQDGAKELADVLEAAICLAESYGTSWKEIEKIAENKRAERGSFAKRIILEM